MNDRELQKLLSALLHQLGGRIEISRASLEAVSLLDTIESYTVPGVDVTVLKLVEDGSKDNE